MLILYIHYTFLKPNVQRLGFVLSQCGGLVFLFSWNRTSFKLCSNVANKVFYFKMSMLPPGEIEEEKKEKIFQFKNRFFFFCLCNTERKTLSYVLHSLYLQVMLSQSMFSWLVTRMSYCLDILLRVCLHTGVVSPKCCGNAAYWKTLATQEQPVSQELKVSLLISFHTQTF